MIVEKLPWDDRLALGVTELDDAHRELVDLYNRIVWACDHYATASAVRERIRTFLLFARWHFGEEEARMRECRYPAYLEHKNDHGRLLQDAEDFVENLQAALEPEDVPAIATYFKYWLVRHMAERDTKLRAFLQIGEMEPGSPS